MMPNIGKLKFLPLVIPAAIAGMAIVSSLTPVKSPAIPPLAEPGGISREKIKQLRYYALSQSCSAEGCEFKLRQSVKAMHTLLGVPARWDELRDYYPINGSSDGGMEPAKVVVFYNVDADTDYKNSIAYSVWVPAHTDYRRLK